MPTRTALLAVFLWAACGSDSGGEGSGEFDASGPGPNPVDAAPRPDAEPPRAPQFSELWYSVDDRLVYIPIDKSNGAVGTFVVSTMQMPPTVGHNMLTMLDDGSLIGARLSDADQKTYFYSIETPPRDGSEVTPVQLGVMPEDIMLEGLYTDCEGRLYGMDTGVNNTSSEGNRLLRFTGDVLAGDFSYMVVSDLATADVADIDDMGPGIVEGEITDNPGLAIDSGEVYDFDYETGSGTAAGAGGDWGIHALGRDLFDDDTARLFVLDSSANLYEMDPENFSLSGALGTGPTDVAGNFVGWSGLAGPLTNCETGFIPIE